MIRARLPRKAGQSKRKRAATPPRSLRAATSGTQKQNNGRVCNFFVFQQADLSQQACSTMKQPSKAKRTPYNGNGAKSEKGDGYNSWPILLSHSLFLGV